MALDAKIDISKSPYRLTVTSDKRHVQATVTVGGEEAKVDAVLEPKITDDSGRKWTKVADDGTTAVYEG